MAINKNHEFEELNGVKCGIVEKNASQARVDFLRPLLEANGFEVIVVPAPAPKAAAAVTPKEGDLPAAEAAAPAAAPTFTIGVTDYTFNPVNAIFGRLLKTRTGKVVTLQYWKDGEDSEAPYYEHHP